MLNNFLAEQRNAGIWTQEGGQPTMEPWPRTGTQPHGLNASFPPFLPLFVLPTALRFPTKNPPRRKKPAPEQGPAAAVTEKPHERTEMPSGCLSTGGGDGPEQLKHRQGCTRAALKSPVRK